MSTLLELLASLPPDALGEGVTVGVVDSQGRETTLNIGPRIETPHESDFSWLLLNAETPPTPAA